MAQQRIVTTVFALSCLVGTPALAQEREPPKMSELSEGDRKEVGRLLKEAKQLIEAGEYEVALIELEQAYALFPHPGILIKQAEAHESLDNTKAALALYEQFVSEQPSSKSAPEVRGKIAYLKRKLTESNSTLSVDSSPGGATVLVTRAEETVLRGTTPLETKLPSGDYRVTVELEGYQTQLEEVSISPNERETLVYEMSRPVAKPGALQWTLVGLGVAAGATAGIVGTQWVLEEQAINTLQASGARRDENNIDQRISDNNTRQIVLWTAAGVSVATLASAWLLWPSAETSVGLVPTRGGAAVTMTGRF